MAKLRLYLVKLITEGHKQWRDYSAVFAENPVQAAEFFLARLVECDALPSGAAWRCYIMLDEYVNDGKPGYKIATDMDGDMRYDIQAGSDGKPFPVYSEKSYA